jgi:hypothetical protein
VTLAERARALGPLPPGWYRVLILEANQSLTHWDSPSFQLARAYADEAAAEAGAQAPVAVIFDDCLREVYRAAAPL